ncbi:MAG: glycosyltransferase family 1 protein [bacterium]|nr:glycosyltransferase family 1 protein [bacterium]
MIIGIDASKAAKEARTGVENFVYQLVLNLAKIDQHNTYFLYTNAPLPTELKKQVNFIEKLNRKKRFWNHLFLPLSVLKAPCDVYLQPTDKIPGSANKKTVAVVHDLAYKHFPAAYSTSEKLRQLRTLKNYAKYAKKIICVSQSTKNDLIKYYPNLKSKIEIIALGYDPEMFHPFENPRDLLKIGCPYILYAGRIEERKNSLRLIRAFLKLKKENNIPHKLVLAGDPGFNFESIFNLINGSDIYSNNIVLPGHINHDRLPEVIARADVFAFPTLYEGFGLAALEALACGAAVVTSNTSSLPEIVGDAALLCDPENVDDIADKIYKFISDEKLRQKYSVAAIKQAEYFSWTNTATQVLKILEKL